MHLSKKHRVTLYEANNYLGGHALTLNEKILVNNKLTDVSFDVGFLVYNNKNYPLISELLNLLKVENIDSSSDVFPTSDYIAPFEPEGDSGEAIYVTRKVTLKNPATALKVLHTAVRFSNA